MDRVDGTGVARRRGHEASRVRAVACGLALPAMMVACGGRVGAPPHDGPSASSPGGPANSGGEDGGATSNGASDATNADAANSSTSCPSSAADNVAATQVSTTGAVVAIVDVQGTMQTQTFAAGFPYFGAGPAYAVAPAGPATCACSSGIPLPDPWQSAGTITVDAPDCGPSLAVLSMPAAADGDRPYAGTPGVAWTPGDVLGVAATGAAGGVGAFSGGLVTAALVANLQPPILEPSSKPVLVPRTEPLVLSWTPEGKAGETVMLRIAQTVSEDSFVQCTCIGPDAPGTMTVPVSMLSRYVPTASAPGTTSAFFTRSIASSVAVGAGAVIWWGSWRPKRPWTSSEPFAPVGPGNAGCGRAWAAPAPGRARGETQGVGRRDRHPRDADVRGQPESRPGQARRRDLRSISQGRPGPAVALVARRGSP